MNLWNLLTVVCGGAALGGAVSAAQIARRTGSIQFAMALTVAFLIALGCTAVISAVGRIVFRRLFAASKEQGARASLIELVGRATYFFAATWCLACPFLDYWMTARFVDCCLR
jgi:hypothetical protein